MALQNETFDIVKARLQERQNGDQFIKHLGAIIDSALLLDKEDPIKKFEEISIILKKTTPQITHTHLNNGAITNWVQDNLKLYHVIASSRLLDLPNLGMCPI